MDYNLTFNSKDELDHPYYRQRVRYDNQLNEKRQNLDKDVALFLMSVEIQRLIAENQELKLYIKSNQDSDLDRVNYEIQIRDLMQKLSALQGEMQYLMADNDRLGLLIRDLEGTIAKQEQMLKGYDPNWRRELDQYKRDISKLQKKIGDDDVDELRNKLKNLQKKCDAMDSKFGGMSPEDLQKMLDEYKKKAQQFDDLNRKLNGNDPSDLIKKMKDLDKLSRALGCDPEDLMKELERLRQKAKDAEDLQKQLGQQSINLGEMDNLRRQLLAYQRENELLKQQLNEIQFKQNQMEQRLKQLQQENDQFRDQIRKKDQELQQLGKQLQDLQRQYQDQNRQLQDLNGRLRQAEIDKNRLQQDLNRCYNDIDKLQLNNDQVDGLQDQIQDLQDEKNHLQDSLNNLLKKLDDKDRIIQDLKNQLERQNQDLQDLKKQVEVAQNNLRNANDKLKDANDQLKDATSKLEWIKQEFGLTDDDLDPRKRKNLNNLKEQKMFQNINPINQLVNYLLLTAENERLGIIIQGYYDENQELQIAIQESSTRIEQLQSQNQSLQEAQQKYSSQEQDLNKLREQYENKIALLANEVSRLKRASVSNLSAPNLDYESSSFRMQQRLSRSNGNQFNSDYRIDNEKSVQDLLCLIVMMTVEIETLRSQLTPTPQLSQMPSNQVIITQTQTKRFTESTVDNILLQSTIHDQMAEKYSKTNRTNHY